MQRTRVATNVRLRGTPYALATTVQNQSAAALASITLVGRTADMQPGEDELARVLLRHVDSWSQRLMSPYEAI
jgi:hypothetical protein